MKRTLFITVATTAVLLLPLASIGRQKAEDLTRDKILQIPSGRKIRQV